MSDLKGPAYELYRGSWHAFAANCHNAAGAMWTKVGMHHGPAVVSEARDWTPALFPGTSDRRQRVLTIIDSVITHKALPRLATGRPLLLSIEHDLRPIAQEVQSYDWKLHLDLDPPPAFLKYLTAQRVGNLITFLLTVADQSELVLSMVEAMVGVRRILTDQPYTLDRVLADENLRALVFTQALEHPERGWHRVKMDVQRIAGSVAAAGIDPAIELPDAEDERDMAVLFEASGMPSHRALAGLVLNEGLEWVRGVWPGYNFPPSARQ